MRPLRRYRQRYVRQQVPEGDTALRELVIDSQGNSPCRARARAFTLLEQRLVQEDLPRTGWRLISQVQLVLVRKTPCP